MAQQSRFTNSGFATDQNDAPMAFCGSTSMCRELFDLALTSNKVGARRPRRNERHDAATFLNPGVRPLNRVSSLERYSAQARMRICDSMKWQSRSLHRLLHGIGQSGLRFIWVPLLYTQNCQYQQGYLQLRG